MRWPEVIGFVINSFSIMGSLKVSITGPLIEFFRGGAFVEGFNAGVDSLIC